MSADPKELYVMIQQIRLCFNQLKSLSEQLLTDLDINPSKRAVLEALNKNGAQTVAAIAKQKSVSRQHIQIIMNALKETAYVDLIDNPAHKRSPQFALTEKGTDIFAEIKRREIEPIARLARRMDGDQIKLASILLGEFNDAMASMLVGK